jgi:hypothetical protein
MGFSFKGFSKALEDVRKAACASSATLGEMRNELLEFVYKGYKSNNARRNAGLRPIRFKQF